MRALLVLAVIAGSARGDGRPAAPPQGGAGVSDGYFRDLVADVRRELDAAHAAKAPALVPPVRVDVKWKPVRIGSLDLGAPLVALVAGDLDKDGKTELYAVTTREVVAYSLEHKPHELGRAAFSGDLAVPSPRDVVGTAIVDGDAVIAAVSVWTTPLRVHWAKRVLVAAPSAPGFALCKGEPLAQLVPGRDYFAGQLYGARCRTDLVDPEGHALSVRATLAITGRLTVKVSRCAPACALVGEHEYANVGVAFEIADVDRDGRPEILVSGAGAPGDPDAVKVMTFGDDEKKPVFRKPFTGGVAGIVDVDGAVIAAVRLVGATRVDLWRLD